MKAKKVGKKTKRTHLWITLSTLSLFMVSTVEPVEWACTLPAVRWKLF